MRLELKPEMLHGAFVQDIETMSEQNLLGCNQCGRCSAGCPLVEEMDWLPNQVIRLAQLGQEAVLASKTPWVCAACLMCQSRCPQGVDLPRVMEAMRQIGLRRGDSRVSASHIDAELLGRAPQMMVVGALRRGER